MKKQIDSLLLAKVKAKTKTYKSDFDSITYRVRFDKKTKEVIDIIEIHRAASESFTSWWEYKYHFRNGTFIMMSKWNNTDLKDKRRQVAFYYFQNDAVVFREENQTTIKGFSSEE